MTVLQTLVTEKKPPLTSNHLRYLSDKRVAKRPIPQLILFRRITPKDKRITTLCTPWTTPSFTVVKKFTRTCVKSTAHAHGTKIRGGYLKPWKTTEGVTRYIMGSSSLTRTVAYRRLTLIQGQGRFTKLGLPRVILPMCIYSVNGVLAPYSTAIDIKPGKSYPILSLYFRSIIHHEGPTLTLFSIHLSTSIE